MCGVRTSRLCYTSSSSSRCACRRACPRYVCGKHRVLQSKTTLCAAVAPQWHLPAQVAHAATDQKPDASRHWQEAHVCQRRHAATQLGMACVHPAQAFACHVFPQRERAMRCRAHNNVAQTATATRQRGVHRLPSLLTTESTSSFHVRHCLAVYIVPRGAKHPNASNKQPALGKTPQHQQHAWPGHTSLLPQQS